MNESIICIPSITWWQPLSLLLSFQHCHRLCRHFLYNPRRHLLCKHIPRCDYPETVISDSDVALINNKKTRPRSGMPLPTRAASWLFLLFSFWQHNQQDPLIYGTESTDPCRSHLAGHSRKNTITVYYSCWHTGDEKEESDEKNPSMLGIRMWEVWAFWMEIAANTHNRWWRTNIH